MYNLVKRLISVRQLKILWFRRMR